MPILGTAAKGTINFVLEQTAGEQIALATTPVLSTLTLTTFSPGLSGNRLHIKIEGWTTSGTVTLTGTGTPNNTETYNIAAPTLQQTQSPELANNEYVSANAYTTFTNITTTGLTNGVITVYSIQSGKYSLPATMVSDRKPKTYSPNAHDGLLERDRKILHLTNNTTFDIKQDAYADLSLWFPYLAFGAPVSTATIPASPTSLFTATALQASQTLTTPPTAPGMKLIIVITSFTVAGTLTITGTVNGIAGTSETISVTAAGTYYSSNVYNAATVTITNATTAATMAVTGVFGWALTFKSGQNPYTAAIEWFDGVGSWTHPFAFATEGDFDAKVQTEISLSLKGKAQDKLPIGDRTTAALAGLNRVSALGVNLNDLPMVGWQTIVYLDPITGTAGTTQYNDVQEFKVSYKMPQEDHFTFTNQQNFNRAYTAKREYMSETTIDFVNMLQWEQFRQNLKQYLYFQFRGQYIGTSSGTQYFKSWTWTLPMKTDGAFDVVSDPKKAIVIAKAKWRAEYDSGIGASMQLVINTTVPPATLTL